MKYFDKALGITAIIAIIGVLVGASIRKLPLEIACGIAVYLTVLPLLIRSIARNVN